MVKEIKKNKELLNEENVAVAPLVGSLFVPLFFILYIIHTSSLNLILKDILMAYLTMIALTIYSEVRYYTFVKIYSDGTIVLNGSWNYLNTYFPILGLVSSLKNKNNEFLPYHWDVKFQNVKAVGYKKTFWDMWLGFGATKTFFIDVTWKGRAYRVTVPLILNAKELLKTFMEMERREVGRFSMESQSKSDNVSTQEVQNDNK